jgi:hypothetical protein
MLIQNQEYAQCHSYFSGLEIKFQVKNNVYYDLYAVYVILRSPQGGSLECSGSLIWLGREIGGKVGRWVAKSVRTAALWVRIQTSPKITKWAT